MDSIIQQFLIDQALVLVPILWIIGAIVKATPKIPDWSIPYVLLVCGVLGAVGMLGFSAASVFQGILAAGTAVYGNQILKQTKEAISSNSTSNTGSSGTDQTGGNQ